MTKPIDKAKRSELRKHEGESFIRITPEDCVLETDIRLLKPQETHQVSVCGKVREKHFHRLELDDNEYLADVITGRLFNAKTGETSSTHLKIITE